MGLAISFAGMVKEKVGVLFTISSKCLCEQYHHFLYQQGYYWLIVAQWAILNTILMSPKSWLSQEDLDAGCEHSLVPVDS